MDLPTEVKIADLEGPRPGVIAESGLVIAGLHGRYNAESCVNIAEQWQSFGPYIGHVNSQVDGVTYGVCYNADQEGNLDYISGVEVRETNLLPPEFATITIPFQQYVVFTQKGHISTIRGTWDALFCQWLPQSKFKLSGGPNFEKYDHRYDAKTGNGGFEIWLAVSPR